MENLNPQKYRDELAEKIKTIRSVDKETAETFLEKQAESPEYQESRLKKIEHHKQSIEEAKKIQEIRESLGVNESKERKESPQTKIFEVLEKVQSLFQNEKEFGAEGKNGAEKIKEITEKIQKFLDTFKQDYLKEYQRTGITPEKFMYEFGIGSIDKEKGGWGGIGIDEYNFQNIKEGWESPKGKTWDNKQRYGGSFSDFSIPIYKKYDWAKESRKVPLFGEWKKEEIHEDWFTPKQEELLYKLLTGNKDFDKKSQELGPYNESATVIPGATLNLREEYASMDKKGKGKPINKGLLNRWYGWRRRESNLELTPSFIKAYLESVKQ